MDIQWQAPPPPVERVFAFQGLIRLLIGMPPGAIVLTLEGRKMAASGVLAFLQTGSIERGQTESILLQNLLREGEAYTLQLESEGEDGGTQKLLGRLCWFKPTAEGYELGFEFEESDEETALFAESLTTKRSRSFELRRGE